MQNEEDNISLDPSLPFDEMDDDEDGDIEYAPVEVEDVDHNPQSEVTHQVKVETPSAPSHAISTESQPPNPRNAFLKRNCCSFIICFCIIVVLPAIIALIVHDRSQRSRNGVPFCVKQDWNKDCYADGKCDRMFNKEECEWDGGDCLLFNSLVNCTEKTYYRLGNGKCNENLNKEECAWDGETAIYTTHL